jgi:putative PEP-CTERM system TPR-repeat lipoprotein
MAGSQVRSIAGAVAALFFVFGLQGALASSADEYVLEADQFLASGEVKSAIIQLKNALQTDPSHVEARVKLGAIYLRTGDGPAAAKEFGRARELGAAKDKWLPGYARALLLQGEFDAILREVEVDDSLPTAQRAELLALRGNANLAKRQIDAAISDYDAALALDTGSVVARLGKAQILLTRGESEQALNELNQVLLDHPGHVESRLARGDLLRRMQRLGDAETDYARAAKEAPQNARAHIGLAMVHVGQRDVSAAKQDLATLKQLAPNLPAVNYLQALVSFQDGDYERASDELQTLLRVAPGNLQAQLLYGIVSYARKEFTIADDYLTRVLASTPGNTEVVKLVGAARLKLRQPDRALEVLSSAVDADTKDAQLLALLGTAYLQTGNNTKGSEYIERAVELDPDQALLRTQLAVGRIGAGDTASAISQLESAVALGQDVVQADVLLVLSYLNKKEFDKAISASEALEQRMADSPIPYNLTGLAFLAQRKFEAADARFRLALEKDPKFVVAQMNLARLALVQQKLDLAANAYQEVLKMDSKHVGAMMGLAALARARNEPDEAESWLLKANEANPQALQPTLLLAEMYLRNNEGLKANNMLSGLTPAQAELPAVLRLKGMAQLQTGDYASAMHTLKKLTEQHPSLMEGWFQLARAQAAAGDSGASRASFERAIALDVEHKVPVVWVGLAELDLREGRYDEALEIAQRMKEHFPDSVYGYDIEAAAYRGKGQTDQALAASEAALRMDGSSRRVIAFARSLSSAGKSSQAIAELQAWLETNSTDGAAWASLGMARQQAGKDAEALQAYEKSIEYMDANPVILNNMAWLYLDRDGKRAVDLATQAYELAPSRAEIVDTYGWVLFKQGRKSDGLAALQQALIIAPRNAEIALHVAEALHVLNRDSEARPILERIARENPNSRFEKSARELLARLKA